MLFRKNIVRILLIIFALTITIFSLNPSVSAQAQTQYLYLGGFPAGFTLSTKTVEVIGICDVVTAEGMRSPARDCGIKTGDIIDKINGENVEKTSDINTLISRDYKRFNVTVIRDGEIIDLDLVPVIELSSGNKRIGALVKDSINGIGTVTYIDAVKNKFASLGHPVTDANNNLVEINGGTVYGCIVYDIKKGVRGTPGELRGAFENNNIIGKADLNCSCGIYGDLSDGIDLSKLKKVEKASLDEVKIGKACIYSTIYGAEPVKYDISIVKVDKVNKENRNFVIKVEDRSLLELSGGIVQGMSGSPIVQDGKIIGAVTHVFVNDPTRGYGIGIDKMLGSY